MAKRTYVANAPLVSQVDRIQIAADQYTLSKIAEGSDITATINDKVLRATVPYKEPVSSGGGWTGIDDGDAVRALLQDFSDKWNESDIPEFLEVECSAPTQNDNRDWYVDLTARVPGIPFTVEIDAPHPVIDVDTVRDGGPGTDEVQSFYLSPVPTAGTYRVLWNLGAGTESSGYVSFDADSATLFDAMAAGMPSLTLDNFTITGSGTEALPFIVTLKDDLGSLDVSLIQVEATALEGNGEVSILTLTNGSAGSSDAVGSSMWSETDPDLVVSTPFGVETISDWNTYDTETLTLVVESLPNVGAGNVEVFVNDYAPSSSRAIGYRFKGGLGGLTGCSISPILTVEGGLSYSYENSGGQSQQPSAYFVRTTGTGGTFTITVDGNTSAAIAFNAARMDVRTALDGITGLGMEDFEVVCLSSGGANPLKTWAIFFFSTVVMTIDDASVTGGEMTVDVMSEGETSTGVNERQSVWTNGLAGTFTLTKPGGSTSAGISPLAAVEDIKAAVEGLYGGTWTVTGSGVESDPWMCEAGGALAGLNQTQMTGSAANLLGASRGIVETLVEGGAGVYEQWSVAINGASGGTFALSFRDHRTTELAFGANAATVEAALEDLDNLTACTVTGSGTVESPYMIEIADTEFELTNIRQLVAWNELLTGSGFPVLVHTTEVDADGPWHWTSDLNWWNPATAAYGVPVNGDDLYFEMGNDRRCPRYGIDQSDLTVIGLSFLANFTDNATVGLPSWNPLGYWEYRETTLKINLSGDGPITIGSRGGGGSPLMNLNTFDSKTTIRIHNTASPVSGEFSAVQWVGTHADNTVEILGGFFGAACYAGQVATLASITQRDGSVLTGAGCSIGDIDKTSGDLMMDRSPVSGVIDIQG